MTAAALPAEIIHFPEEQPRNAETRMKDANACRRLVQTTIKEDEQRGWRRAVAKGQHDGNPPYSTVEPGYSWTCNLNFGEMEGLMDGARIPYYALFSGVPTYAAFKTAHQRENPESEQWNKIMAEEWTDLLNRWKPGFRWHMRASEFEMLFDGWGVWLFEDPTGWRFTSIPARCIKVPQGAYSCVDERLPFLVIMRDFRIHELWEKISDEKAAAGRGWNVAAVKAAITRGCNNKANKQADWEYWQQRLRNADICASFTESDVVRCATLLVKEYAKSGKPGKISELMVTVDELGSSDGEAKEGGEYLFTSPNQYDSYNDALIVSFQNTGDGTWHSVRGIGLKAVKHIMVSNRLLCRIVDNAFLGSTPIIKPSSNNAKDKMQLMVMGAVAHLAPGAELEQNRLAADISGPMSASRMLTNHLAQNIGHYNQRSISRDDGRGEQPTATQVEMQAGKETALSQAQIDSRYDDLDMLYEQMFSRAKKGPDAESQRFVKNCLDRGVPQEAMDNMAWVKANRLAGYPSPEMRKRNLREIFGIVGMLPEDGKRNLVDELISVYCGPDKINVYNPKLDEPDMDAAWAVVENSMMEDGDVPLIVSGMNHVTHLSIHLQDAADKMQPLKESMDSGEGIDTEQLEESYRYVATLAQHCEEHLAPLASDPARKGPYDTFRTQLKNVAAFHGKLRGAILDARRTAQQQQLEQENALALGAMDQAKLESMQADIQRKDVQAATDIQRKNWKAQETQKLKNQQASQSTRLKAATTVADIQIKRTESAAKTKAPKEDRK